jgi:hypothetical protein
LRITGDLDDQSANGAEAVSLDQIVTVGSSGLVLAPRLSRGWRVSGTFVAPATMSASRLFRLSLINGEGQETKSMNVAAIAGGAAPYSFDGIGDGRYTLTAVDVTTPRAYDVADANVIVGGGDVSGVTLSASGAGVIRARLSLIQSLPSGQQQAVLISADNAALLPTGFSVTAISQSKRYSLRASPTGSFLDSLGRVVLDGLTAGNYDLLFSAPSDTSTLSSGGVAIAPTRISGVNVSAGQAVDVGVVALFMGSFIQGQVLDATTGLPIAGEPIMARPSDNALKVSAVTTTDASGHYVLRGLDPTRRWYDVTAGPRGGRRWSA